MPPMASILMVAMAINAMAKSIELEDNGMLHFIVCDICGNPAVTEMPISKKDTLLFCKECGPGTVAFSEYIQTVRIRKSEAKKMIVRTLKRVLTMIPEEMDAFSKNECMENRDGTYSVDGKTMKAILHLTYEDMPHPNLELHRFHVDHYELLKRYHNVHHTY